MKIYIKEFRPMVQPLVSSEFASEPYPPYPLVSENTWFDEEEVEEFKAGLEELVKLKDENGTLTFDERYKCMGEV